MTRPTDPHDLFRTIIELIEAGRPFAVATVLQADGSTPVMAGAKAVIEADGTIHGTVGGGAVEAEAQRQATLVVCSGKPVVFDRDLRGPGVHEPNPICGGSMRLLVAPSLSAGSTDYHQAAATLARRERGVWLTTLRQGDGLEAKSQFLAEADLAKDNSLLNAEFLNTRLIEETPALVASPGAEPIEVFIEPLIPRPVLLIVGGGHVGQAVAAQANLLGFEVAVIDDRPEFADPAIFPPGAKTHCRPVAQELAAFPVNRNTSIVIVTRGHPQDSLALRACIRRPAAYLGMIGSRRKVPLVRRQFIENGWATAEEFDRVHAPIGLDIGAVTVPEIATSIMAQIIAVRRRGVAPRIPLT
jgi:xanthine dehydrogenase accessory factor